MPANPEAPMGGLRRNAPQPTYRKWLIYALGDGWGHLNRAIALSRSLIPQHSVHILASSPQASSLSALLAGTNVQIQAIAPQSTPADAREQVCRWLDTLPHDGLIVDTFPRGLLGELAPYLEQGDRPRILIHRDLNPHYVATHHLQEFVHRHYDRVWIPGEGATVPFASLPQAYPTPPWLVRHPGELPDRPTACSILKVQEDFAGPLVLLLVSGQPQEQAFFEAVGAAIAHTLPQVTVRLIAATPPAESLRDRWISHYPAMDVLWLADAVIGSGGYNTVYECLALQVPLIAVPWKRLYDRQAQRLEKARQNGHAVHIVRSVPDVLTALQDVLETAPHPAPLVPPRYVNGAIASKLLCPLLT